MLDSVVFRDVQVRSNWVECKLGVVRRGRGGLSRIKVFWVLLTSVWVGSRMVSLDHDRYG